MHCPKKGEGNPKKSQTSHSKFSFDIFEWGRKGGGVNFVKLLWIWTIGPLSPSIFQRRHLWEMDQGKGQNVSVKEAGESNYYWLIGICSIGTKSHNRIKFDLYLMIWVLVTYLIWFYKGGLNSWIFHASFRCPDPGDSLVF